MAARKHIRDIAALAKREGFDRVDATPTNKSHVRMVMALRDGRSTVMIVSPNTASAENYYNIRSTIRKLYRDLTGANDVPSHSQ